MSIRVGIVGGTGYTGGELLRLLARHPSAEIVAVTSRSLAGQPVGDAFQGLRGVVGLDFVEPEPANLEGCDAVFFATPNGTAMHQVPALLERGVRVIDLSADFRFRDAAEWSHWYAMTHACPDLLPQAVYGLPEVNRDSIRAARLLANPGCYPTAVQLALLPLLEQRLVEPESLIADVKSGVSGAGRRADADLIFPETADTLRAYGVHGHRHMPEIVQGLTRATGLRPALTFVPHLVPMIRGIHATVYANLVGSAPDDLTAVFKARYAGEPFIDVMAPGATPETRSVRGSNVCRLSVIRAAGRERQVVVLAVIDNLVKGAAGQAVQNFNLMFDLPEASGLDLVPVS